MSGVFCLAAICFAFVGLLIGMSSLMDGIVLQQLILAGLVFFISVSLFFAFRRKDWTINRVEGFILLLLLWAIIPLPVALGFMQLTNLTLIDAYFEATSSFTTTGASVLSNTLELPVSLMFLRSAFQWLGGLLTLLGVVMIMAPTGLGGLPIQQSATINRTNRISTGVARQTFMTIFFGYTFLSFLCFVALVLCQVPVFNAFTLTLSTVSSGGMRQNEIPISEIGHQVTPLVLALFMIAAGTSILWQRQLVAARTEFLRSHREVYLYFAVILIFSMIYSAVFFDRAGSINVLSPFTAITEGVFTAASLVSTTGFEIRHGSFSVLPATLVLVVVLVGGCSFSTAGGISFYRVGGMVLYCLYDLTKLVYPNSVQPARFGRQTYTLNLINSIWTYFFAVMVVLMVATLLLALQLSSFQAALIASIAALSNMGAFYSTGWDEAGQWQNYEEMGSFSKLVLISLMILGRLHILILLAAFNRTYWFRAR